MKVPNIGIRTIETLCANCHRSQVVLNTHLPLSSSEFDPSLRANAGIERVFDFLHFGDEVGGFN